ncbi:MAG: translation initiation factor [Puia sp.]|nr:translation initiation factor [Puia sp.]
MSKKKTGTGGIVYSTDPGFRPEEEPDETPDALSPTQQKLRLRLDTRQRAGKAVTLVEGFRGSDADLEDLGKKCKTFCGTGGSVKDGIAIVQGDQREKLLQWFKKSGYPLTKII